MIVRQFGSTVVVSLVLSSAVFADEPRALRLSEPVAADDRSETFGAPIAVGQQPMSLASLVSRADELGNQPIAVTARVASVCQKKGCFFVAQDGAVTVRVSFRDYSFFVPTDIAGRRVTLVGELVRRSVSAAQAEHYAEDLGDEASSVAEGEVFEIVATSVRIPRAQS